MGRYCLIGEGAVLRPPGKIYKGAFTFYPVRILDYVHIGAECIVEAASIGSCIEIGERSIIVSHVHALWLCGFVLGDGQSRAMGLGRQEEEEECARERRRRNSTETLRRDI